MSLPSELSGIFVVKQKSYKMVLIIALLQEMNVTGKREVSMENVKARFLSFLQQREANNEPVDAPVGTVVRWADATRSQITQIIDSPIEALKNILDLNNQQKTLSFKERLQLMGSRGPRRAL